MNPFKGLPLIGLCLSSLATAQQYPAKAIRVILSFPPGGGANGNIATEATANAGPLLGHVRGDKLNPLAVTSKTRAAVLPNVPTIAESGLPGYESATWYGFLGPAAISKDVVARVNSVAGTALKNQDTRERFVALGAEPVTSARTKSYP